MSELKEKGLGVFINLDKWGISTFTLKIIAMITMIIDHVGFLFFQDNHQTYIILRSIGRISFPIFCFVLVEGFFHTSDRLKHAIRLGIFALVSEIPYDMLYGRFFDMARQNVIFTLFIGYMAIWALQSISMFRVAYSDKILKHIGAGRLNTILELVTLAVAFGMAYFLHTSYSYGGVMLIICFYVFNNHHIGRAISNMVFNIGMFGFGVQWWGALSVLPIAFYNKKPGTKKNFQKKIFIGDSSSLTLLDDLDGYETTFKSSNPSILKVTKVSENTCDYYGMAAGKATIQIRIRSTSGLFFMNRPTTLKAKVSVSPHAVSIKFKHSKYKITESKTRKVRITLRPSITKEKPVYTVLNTRIATINKKGVLRGKRPGTTYVTATLANGVRAKCKIVVKSADK